MSLEWQAAWQALVHHPLFGVGITLGVYQLAIAGYERTRWVFLQPVLVSMLAVIGILLACGLTFVEYRDSVAPLTLFLGPATVALAVPLFLNLRRIRQLFWPTLITLLIAGVFATVMGVGLAWAADGFVVSGAYQSFNDANKRSLDATTLGAAYQWGSVRLAANAGHNKAETAAGRFTVQRVLSAGGTWAATPWVDLTAAYYKVDRSRTGAADDGYGRLVAFAEYKLSRRTKVYAELDNTRWRNGFQGASNKATATGISAGVVHTF